MTRSETVYLHLKPGQYMSDLNVSKMTKSVGRAEPGVVIVKAKISVPDSFFREARPYAEITFQPGDEVPPAEVLIDVDREVSDD